MKIRELISEAIDVNQTRNKYGPQIAKRLKLTGDAADQQQWVEEFIANWRADNADLNNTYTLWLLTHWLNGNIQQIEDVERAKSYVKTFDQNKRKMDQSKRDINRYVPFVSSQQKKPNQLVLQTELEHFAIDNPPDEELLARDIEQAKKQVKVIHRDNSVIIFQPLTELAANVWGRDTDWCTAYGYKFGKNPSLTNQFDYYNNQGPMYIFSFSDGTKYQLHNASKQFMDVDDQPVQSFEDKKWNSLKFLPKDELEKLAVWNLGAIPDELKTPELCLAAVKENVQALAFVPKQLLTPELCLAAVKENVQALAFVPKQLLTPELCLAAVKENVQALEYVPNRLLTPELCLAAVKEDVQALYYVPKQLLTPELCLAAVKQNVWALEYVPDRLLTPEICSAAVEQDSRALQYVPDRLLTPELCLAAVKENGLVLKYVPEELRTPELCLAAVEEDVQALYYVPEELRTPELCLAAVEQDGWALQFVPEELLTPDFLLAAVKQNVRAFEYVPDRLLTPELCLAAVKQKGLAIADVPRHLLTLEICRAAVKQDKGALHYMPDQFRDKIKKELGL